MKTLNILVILCMISSLGLNNLKAQEPQKISYQKISGITSIGIKNLDTTKLAILVIRPRLDIILYDSILKKNNIPYNSNKTNSHSADGLRILLLLRAFH
ncbi:MAG TPA: hypothetical protein VIK14_13015 [Ignavibacteria bacterium]